MKAHHNAISEPEPPQSAASPPAQGVLYNANPKTRAQPARPSLTLYRWEMNKQERDENPSSDFVEFRDSQVHGGRELRPGEMIDSAAVAAAATVRAS